MLDRLKRLPARVGAWVMAMPGRAKAWLTSPVGRIVWHRLAAAPLLIIATPYLTVVWRIMVGGLGVASDQMWVLGTCLLLWLFLDGRRRVKASKAAPAGRDPKGSKPKRRRRRSA